LPDEQIVTLYASGLDSETVAGRAGCSGKTVLDIVRAAGHPVRRPGAGSGRPLALTPEQIIARYEAGESGVRLADAAGCVPSTIYNILRHHNVTLRDRNPGAATLRARAARRARQALPDG
jgi:hypothetical protein